MVLTSFLAVKLGLKLLAKILSKSVLQLDVVRVKRIIKGSKVLENMLFRRFAISMSLSYLNKLILKSPDKNVCLFSGDKLFSSE